MNIALNLLETIAASFAGLAFIFAILGAIEIVSPKERVSLKTRLRGYLFWALALPVTVCFNAGLGSTWARLGVPPLITLPVDWWFSWAGLAALVLAPIAAAIVHDFFFYWFHRAQHTRLLWRFHAVHHSIRDLHAGSGYHHVSEPIFRFVLMTVPASLVTHDATMLVGISTVLIMQQHYVHSSSSAGLGLGRILFVDNYFHRIHHSLEAQHFDKNFGACTTLWDRLFGTAYWPATDEWPAVGLADVAEPQTVREYLDLPIRYRPQPEAVLPTLEAPAR